MEKCKRCYSYAISHHCHGRDGSDPQLCDVCFWRKRAELAMQHQETIEEMVARRVSEHACAMSLDKMGKCFVCESESPGRMVKD